MGRGDRAGLEAYVDEVSAPTKQGPAMRLAGIPIESKFYLVGKGPPPASPSSVNFQETSPSDVPKFLDAEMVRVYEDTAA